MMRLDVPATHLSLHYNPKLHDSRPRVKVEFPRTAPGIGFSLLLSTGSPRSHIVKANVSVSSGHLDSYIPLDKEMRPAKWLEGYPLVGDLSKVDEMANFFSGDISFFHELEIDVKPRIENSGTGIGVLGAGRTSHFTETVGIFAYVGPSLAYTGLPAQASGTLVIGERNVSSLQQYCSDPEKEFAFTATKPRTSRIHWVIDGAIGLTKDTMIQTEWIIDTSAEALYVTDEVFEELIGGITAAGGYVDPEFTRIMVFPSMWRETFPSLTFRLGSFDVTVPPWEYLRCPLGQMTNCRFRLYTGTVGSGNRRILGMPVLGKLATIFDRENDRVGFCLARNETKSYSIF